MDMLYRNERQEKYATDRTKRFRQMLDKAGIKWGLGTHPNIETQYITCSSVGHMMVSVITLTDETTIVMWNIDKELTDEQLGEVARLGVSVGMPILEV